MRVIMGDTHQHMDLFYYGCKYQKKPTLVTFLHLSICYVFSPT